MPMLSGQGGPAARRQATKAPDHAGALERETMAETGTTKTELMTSQMELHVSEDRLTVTMSCTSEMVQRCDFRGELQNRLIGMGIRVPTDNERLEKAVSECKAENKGIADLVVARGTAPLPSQDARLDWQGDFFKPGYQIDPETGRIDYHQKAQKIDVEKDQLLVRLIPSQAGKDGSDVYGLPIKVARPKEASLRGGPGIVWDETEKGYRALYPGKVRLTGRVLDVDKVFFVKGDVGSATGNIKHNGPLRVDGNIEADFNVEATGDVEVRGLVYASNIICGGNLIAQEGINENPSRRIVVSGDIAAKYLLNAVVEARGNIVIQNEIFQSQIRTSGEVTCGKGRIVGGETLAARGIVVGEVGSRANVKTALIAGVDFSLLEKSKKYLEEIERLKLQHKKLTPVFNKLKAAQSALTAEQKEGMTELSFLINEAEEGIGELEEKYKEVRQAIYANKDAIIKVNNMAYPGVTFRIFDSQVTLDTTLLGPIIVNINPITTEITMTSGQ